MFDFKLRHMRDDIAAIEASNNTLELQSRNNGMLLTAVGKLLNNLALDSSVSMLLENPVLDPYR